MESFETGYNEINSREKNGVLSVTLADCKAFAEMGAIAAVKDAQSERDAMAGVQAQMQNMQAQHAQDMRQLQQQTPSTTTCRPIGGAVNCTTY